MKTLKRVISLALSMSMLITVTNTNIYASTPNDDDWKSHIIAGSGTLEDPFVLDGTDNEAQQFLDNQWKNEIIGNSSDNGITPFSNTPLLLKGTKHTGCTSGAYWKYKSGGPNASNQDMVKMLYVDYLPFSYTDALFRKMQSTTNFQQVLYDITLQVFPAGAAALVTRLTSVFGSSLVAKAAALLTGVGTGIAVGLAVRDIRSSLYKDMITSAWNANKGLISAEFASAYQGYWLYNKTLDVWSTYPTAYEPISITGTGDFVPLVRL